MEILSKSNGIHGIYPMKSHQIQWKSYQHLMGFMGFIGLSNEIQSNPMEILSKFTGIHRIHVIYPMKSYQIQWKSYQNQMGFIGFMGFIQ